MIMMRKTMHVEFDDRDTGVGRSGEKWVIAKISSSAVDSDGDVLIPAGADLKEYRKNPVIRWMHSDGQLPIGKAVGIRPRPTDIVAKIVFAARPKSLPDTVEWPPDVIHDLYQQEVLRGFSIGADVIPGGVRRAVPDDIHRFGSGVQRVISRWILREVSVVDLPANPDSYAMAVSKGTIQRGGWVHQRMEAALATWELDQDGDNRMEKAIDTLVLRRVISAERPAMQLRRRG